MAAPKGSAAGRVPCACPVQPAAAPASPARRVCPASLGQPSVGSGSRPVPGGGNAGSAPAASLRSQRCKLMMSAAGGRAAPRTPVTSPPPRAGNGGPAGWPGRAEGGHCPGNPCQAGAAADLIPTSTKGPQTPGPGQFLAVWVMGEPCVSWAGLAAVAVPSLDATGTPRDRAVGLVLWDAPPSLLPHHQNCRGCSPLPRAAGGSRRCPHGPARLWQESAAG